MTTVVTSMRFACRRRTAADWTSGNEILLAGEIGYETDTGKFKIGDGVTAWNSIVGYFSKTGGGGSSVWGGITGTLADQLDLKAALDLKVPTSRTINGHDLSANVTLSAADVGLGNVENTALSTWAGSSNLTTVGTIGTGTWQGTAVGVSYGGTGATSQSGARTNLGLVIGTDVQAYDADLDIWAGITPSTDIQAFLGAANDTAARTELGLGSLATQNADNATVTNFTVSGAVNATGATWTGLTPKFTFVDGSSSANLTAIQLSGTVLGNPTQSGNVTHVLPAIEAGLQFDTILGLTAAFYFRLDPNANDSIYLDGVSCTDGKYIGLTTVTVGDAISCRAMKTGASTYDWACYTAKGAWACE